MQLRYQLHIVRPAVGWFAALLAVVAALTPSLAAAQSPLEPLGAPFFWGALAGLLVGYDRAATARRRPRLPAILAVWRIGAHAIVWIIGGLLLVAAAGSALPPLGLALQDLGGIIARLQGLGADVGEPRLPRFMASAATRLSQDLAIAPASGNAGARLLVGTVGTLATWAAAIIFGHALAGARRPLAYALPLLGALSLVAIPGGAGGPALAIGSLAIILFSALADAMARTREWDQHQSDYSEEIVGDVRLWATIIGTLVLFAAWVVPLWPGNPISNLIHQISMPGSGVAALETGMAQPSSGGDTEIGISTLPSLRLGASIAQGPDEQPALTIRLSAPPPAGSGPLYWRARLFESYSGRVWSADARVEPQAAANTNLAFEGGVQQIISDLRPDRQLLVGLADIIAVDIPTRAERLEDGTLTALAGDPPVSSYRVLSRPQELAPPPPRDRAPPDMSPYLQIPPSVPPRVRELALAIVGDAQIPHQQALALERYLRELPYSYEVARLPQDAEAVDQFLFEMRSGYCTYYASSMVIMARSLGIPARVAQGYATGKIGPDGRYQIREADAHAWPELYINERWVIYEPTPVRPLPARGANPSGEPAIVAELPEGAPQDRVPWGLVVVLVIAIALIATVIVRRRGQQEKDLLTSAAEALEQAGARRGVAWPDSATLREFRDQLQPSAGDLSAAVEQTASLIERGRYTQRKLRFDEVARLEELCDELEDRQS